jgi:thiamine biosynthesis lipoprotein
MGTQFTLTLYAPDSLVAIRANAAVSARMDSLNQVMSDYLDGSEINQLSATAGSGQWVSISPDLFNVLAKARTIARSSGGRFDPTVGPLSLLWRRAVRRGEFPRAKQRRQAHRAVGYRLLELDSTHQRARLRRAGMRLDVGGIGQGFANDEAMQVLRRLGIRSALLDLGGDILTSDAPPDQSGWRVGIGSLDTGDTTTLVLHNQAITTSGDLYRHLDYRGRRYSHIMNPQSGLGLRHFVRATVSAPTGWQADALTKVFSVAGLCRSRRLIRRFPNVAIQLVERKRGRLHNWQSTSFPDDAN